MAANNHNPSDFLTQMYDMQQMYMKNMEQMFNFQKPLAEDKNPFEHWWKQMSETAQPTGLMNLQNPFAENAGVNDWFGQMHNTFQQWMESSKPSNPFFDNINEQFKNQLAAPFDASMFAPPQDALDPFNLSRNINSQVVNLLQQLFVSEEKKEGEKLLDTLKKYQNVMMQYNHMMANVGIESLNKLQQKLDKSDTPDMANMYESWMEITQEIYKKDFHSADGKQLADQLSTIQDQLAEDYEAYRLALAKNFGLVSQTDVDDLKQEIAQLKAEIKKLK